MNEALTRLDIFAEEEEIADIVTGFLTRFVSYGWEETSLPSGEIRFRVHTDNAILLQELLEAFAVLPDVRVERSEIPREDWALAWRAFFTPVEAGDFLIVPPWLVDQTPLNGKFPIVIEPKSAFGTGHHNTTVLCLEALTCLKNEGRLTPSMRFFDVGTGTGILGMACCHYGLTGLGVDIDPVAVANAQENSQLNDMESRFAIRPGSAEAGNSEQYDVIVANILAQPLRDLAPELIGSLKEGGCLVLSGLLDVQADSVEAAYAELGSARRLASADWVALVWPR